MDHNQEILDFAQTVSDWNLVGLKDIPRIPLYMEQLTGFFDEALAGARRNSDDKILTKTMINNYTKEGTLPRPFGKKYGREHMIRLMFIFMLKQVLSLQDIRQIFELLHTERNIEAVYGVFVEMLGDETREQFLQVLGGRMERVEAKLQEKGLYTEETFDLMLMLLTVADATAGKMLIWRMLDERAAQRADAAKDKEKK